MSCVTQSCSLNICTGLQALTRFVLLQSEKKGNVVSSLMQMRHLADLKMPTISHLVHQLLLSVSVQGSWFRVSLGRSSHNTQHRVWALDSQVKRKRRRTSDEECIRCLNIRVCYVRTENKQRKKLFERLGFFLCLLYKKRRASIKKLWFAAQSIGRSLCHRLNIVLNSVNLVIMTAIGGLWLEPAKIFFLFGQIITIIYFLKFCKT